MSTKAFVWFLNLLINLGRSDIFIELSNPWTLYVSSKFLKVHYKCLRFLYVGTGPCDFADHLYWAQEFFFKESFEIFYVDDVICK